MHRYRLLPFFFLVALVGCASRRPAEPFYTRLIAGSYDEVWDAALKSVRDYPLKFTNKDSGKVQTEVVNGPYNELVFTYPEPLELPERFRFSMKLQLAKVSKPEEADVVRVRITKELEKFNDFYTGWTAFPPDGIEEQVLLYRLGQLFEMQRALASSSKPKPGAE